MRKYRNYTDEDIIKAVKISTSLNQVLNKLNLKMAGGNYNTLKRQIAKLNLDTTHFTGMLWSKGKMLKDWANYKHTHNIKKHLKKLKGNKCESCGLSEWMNQEIPIECHHIDGNNLNNVIDNLQLLCCNCHALTNNFRNRKRNN